MGCESGFLRKVQSEKTQILARSVDRCGFSQVSQVYLTCAELEGLGPEHPDIWR